MYVRRKLERNNLVVYMFMYSLCLKILSGHPVNNPLYIILLNTL